jgi:hypothetical protein
MVKWEFEFEFGVQKESTSTFNTTRGMYVRTVRESDGDQVGRSKHAINSVWKETENTPPNIPYLRCHTIPYHLRRL